MERGTTSDSMVHELWRSGKLVGRSWLAFAKGQRLRTDLTRGHCSSLQDFFDCRDRGVQFLVRIVEVGGHAHAGLGSPIDKNVAFQELAADFLRIRHVNGDRSPAFLGIPGSIYSPAMLVC